MTTAVEGKVTTLRVGNAPCSWGTLEFEEAKGEQITVRPDARRTGRDRLHGNGTGRLGLHADRPGRAARRNSTTAAGDARRVRAGGVERRESRTRRGCESAVKTARLLAAVAADPEAIPGAGGQ